MGLDHWKAFLAMIQILLTADHGSPLQQFWHELHSSVGVPDDLQYILFQQEDDDRGYVGVSISWTEQWQAQLTLGCTCLCPVQTAESLTRRQGT